MRTGGRRAEELRAEFDRLLALAGRGIAELVAHQRRTLGL